MITAKDVQQCSFTRAGKGYKMEEVDNLLEEVVSTLRSYEKESEDTKKQIELLNAKIKEYRENEDSIRVALVTAQCSADKIMKETKEKKDALEQEARQKAETVFEASKEKSKEMLSMAKSKAEELISGGQKKHNNLIDEAKEISETLISRVKEECKEEARKLEELKKRNIAFRKMIAKQYCEQFELLKNMNFDFSEVPSEEVTDSEIESSIDKVEEEIRNDSRKNIPNDAGETENADSNIVVENADEFLDKASKNTVKNDPDPGPVEDIYGNPVNDDAYVESISSGGEDSDGENLNVLFDVVDENDSSDEAPGDFAGSIEKKAEDNKRFGNSDDNDGESSGFGIFHKK